MSNVTNVLEEFWYGNLEPAEYDTSSSKEYKALLQLISRNEDKLPVPDFVRSPLLFLRYNAGLIGIIRRRLAEQYTRETAAASLFPVKLY